MPNSKCPTCKVSLGTNPELLFRPDPILQTIIGKLLPKNSVPELPVKEAEIVIKIKLDKPWIHKIYGSKGREFCFANEQLKSIKAHNSSTVLELKKCILKRLSRARGLDIYCKDLPLDESWTVRHLQEVYPSQEELTIKPHLI
jgi:hypothetical protein